MRLPSLHNFHSHLLDVISVNLLLHLSLLEVMTVRLDLLHLLFLPELMNLDPYLLHHLFRLESMCHALLFHLHLPLPHLPILHLISPLHQFP